MSQDFLGGSRNASQHGESKSSDWAQDPELVQEFVTEANEHLATVEEDILAVERLGAAGSGEVIHHLFRSLHTVKGGASLLGFSAINQLAHALENAVGVVRSGELAVDRPLIDVLLKGTDTLKRLVQHPHDASYDTQPDLEAVQAVLARKARRRIRRRPKALRRLRKGSRFPPLRKSRPSVRGAAGRRGHEAGRQRPSIRPARPTGWRPAVARPGSPRNQPATSRCASRWCSWTG